MRTHGPLDIEDPKILDPVQYLPENTQELIKKAGGITDVLVASKLFAVQGQTICPIEDIVTMKDSLSSSSGTGQPKKASSAAVRQGAFQKTEKPKESGGKVATKPARVDSKGKGGGDGNVDDKKAGKKPASGVAASGGKGRGQGAKQASRFAKMEKEEEEMEDYDCDDDDDENSTSRYLAEILKASLGHEMRKKKVEADSEGLSEDVGSCSPHSLGSEDDARPPTVSTGVRNSVNVDLSAALDKLMSNKRQVREASSSSSRGKERASVKEGARRDEAEHGKGGDRKVRSGPAAERSEVFSPTNSSCSVSSSSSSSSVATSLKLIKESPQKKPSKGKTTKPAASVKTRPTPVVVVPVSTSCAEVQTDPPLMKDKWVMTDHPQHQTTENYKDRYELVKKEKQDLQGKLETSEDQKFKMQKSHKRELDDVARKTKKEVQEVG